MANDFQIEPELLGRTPRRVRRKRATRIGGLGLGWIILFPFIAMGIGLVAVAGCCTLFVILLGAFGDVVPGQITDRRTDTNDDGTTTYYYLRYSYRVGETKYARKALVSQACYDGAADRAAVSVRVFPLTPGFGSHLMVPGNKSVRLWGLWLFALLWNAFTSSFVWVTILHVVKDRTLVARGQPVEGRIVDKEVRDNQDDNGNVTYLLHYEYVPQDSRQADAVSSATRTSDLRMRGEMSVDKATDFDAVSVGDRVTVLYTPGRPCDSLIYRFADHEVPTRFASGSAEGDATATRRRRRRQRRGS